MDTENKNSITLFILIFIFLVVWIVKYLNKASIVTAEFGAAVNIKDLPAVLKAEEPAPPALLQEQAAEALEQMLEDLEAGQRAREEALSRTLKSIIESLDGLIADQQKEIKNLTVSVDLGTPLSRLAPGMIRLNQNTLGVRDLAFEGGTELAPIFTLLKNASDAQGRAIRELRDPEPASDEAREHEALSLELLTRARARANEAQEDIEQKQDEEKKAALKEAYFKALEAQVKLRDEAAPFAQADSLSRRDRVIVRRMGEPQRAVGAILTDLRESVKELKEAKVFDYAHDRLDRLIDQAAAQLEASEPARAVRTQGSIIRVIEGLINALEESKNEQGDEGNSQEGGSGGQGQPQGDQALIPPAQELKLLRDLQIQLAEETAFASVDPAVVGEEVEALGKTQRELLELGEDLIRRASAPPGGGGPVDPNDIFEPVPLRPEDEAGSNDAPVNPEKGKNIGGNSETKSTDASADGTNDKESDGGE